ncbi:uncharacterized protein LOC135359422 isoform X1 [Latimeria chalumnae]|uniref:uncharacterized protein LOC135359422 isoform X1 n=1 Tax=Latimeria chalumnae TaxID=7897 RepID=UPI00313C7DF3
MRKLLVPQEMSRAHSCPLILTSGSEIHQETCPLQRWKSADAIWEEKRSFHLVGIPEKEGPSLKVEVGLRLNAWGTPTPSPEVDLSLCSETGETTEGTAVNTGFLGVPTEEEPALNPKDPQRRSFLCMPAFWTRRIGKKTRSPPKESEDGNVELENKIPKKKEDAPSDGVDMRELETSSVLRKLVCCCGPNFSCILKFLKRKEKKSKDAIEDEDAGGCSQEEAEQLLVTMESQADFNEAETQSSRGR